MSITHLPTAPTTTDNVTIKVSGYFPDGCWEPAALDSFRLSGNTIYIFSSANDNWNGGSCPTILVPYEFTASFGPLAAGDYTVVSSMQTNSLRWSFGVFCTHNFSVATAKSIPSLPKFGVIFLALLLSGIATLFIRQIGMVAQGEKGLGSWDRFA